MFSELDKDQRDKLYNMIYQTLYQMDEKTDNLIRGRLDNGMIIELFDYKNYAREFKVNMVIDCLIVAFYPQINSIDFTKGHKKDKPILTGRFIKEYIIPESWWTHKESLKSKTYPVVQTVNGIILLYFNKDPTNLKDGEVITFFEGRLDLLAWRPLE